MLSRNMKLKNIEIPLIGIGTYQLRGTACYQALNFALSIGYRHIDCSPSYLNEHMVAIALSSVDRSSLFLSSKLSYGYYSPSACEHSFKKSLSNLKTDYLDLYMLEWPEAKKLDGKKQGSRAEAWSKVLSLKTQGAIRYAGVSNFSVKDLRDFINETGVKPDIVQNEINPLKFNREVKEFCDENGMLLVAHTPLARYSRKLIGNLEIIRLSKKYKVSLAQIVLRWTVEKGIGVIPRSSNTEHIRQNTMLDFQISAEDLELINNLSKKFDYFFHIIN